MKNTNNWKAATAAGVASDGSFDFPTPYGTPPGAEERTLELTVTSLEKR